MAETKRATDPFDVGVIDHRPLREQIADRLQESVLSGELAPGQSIVETEIASHFGVSRAPVREALQILANRGLVVAEPYRGTTVRRLERRDVEEIYEMRSVLESYAIRRVLRTRGPEVVSQLRELCVEMEAAARRGDWRAVSEIDDRFHSTLIRSADRAVLSRFWDDISMRVRQIMALRNLKNEDIMAVVQNHLSIIEAIDRGDAGEAVALMDDHIATASDLMLEHDLFEVERDTMDT